MAERLRAAAGAGDGSTTDHTIWDGILPTLGRYFTVYAIDRRGRGASGEAPTYVVEWEFEDVATVVDSLGEPVHLLGHSYGALCALEATRLTSNIAKLVLYDPPAVGGGSGFGPGLTDELDELIAHNKWDEALARLLVVVLHRSPEYVDQLRADPSWAARMAAAHTVPREAHIAEVYRFEPSRFAAIRTPMLLLEGEVSPPFLKASVAAVLAGLPHSRRVVLSGEGHGATEGVPECCGDAWLVVPLARPVKPRRSPMWPVGLYHNIVASYWDNTRQLQGSIRKTKLQILPDARAIA